ncbi:ABC transporter ATP-binding protein [Yimella sp. RIT 621]|uniref:ABC transporter ATP-binding protein n=1 Tax=Yimella sp. RIT 621 TaxID=2510323 RepID=UPI00101BE72F|nr:ATP-binding cassette domain-containing protein [Yimella sp. RIT 621]RYG76503.1 ABC transporter ATP-binding protein [Yimella sp. RIT 621]
MSTQALTDDRNDSTPVMQLRGVHVVHKTRTGGLFRPGTVRAVDGVDFEVHRGETVGVVGESGSGKSTLARVLVGLQKPTDGEVLFEGEPLRYDASTRRRLGRTVSVVFQDPATALNPRMPVRDQLLDPLNVHRIGRPAEREKRVRELLDLVGLPASALDVMPRQISGGQRQRVAIARALALEPAIIVADEPTSALDVSVRAQVLNLLTDLKEALGLGLVFISHDISTVRYVSDRIAVMNRGSIVETGSAEQVFFSPKQDYTRELLRATPTLLKPAATQAASTSTQGDS